MIKLLTANASILAAVWATVTLKFCSMRGIPPRKKDMPITRSRLDKILPMSEVCTMRVLPWTSAMIATINSTALLYGLEMVLCKEITGSVKHTQTKHSGDHRLFHSCWKRYKH